MTKLSNVRLSTKFVFRGEPGVWKKISKSKAKCIFGPSSVQGVETEVNLEAEVFVIESASKGINETVPGNECMKVVFVEDDDKVVCERIVPIGQATVLATCHVVVMRTGKHKEILSIGDAGFDMEKRELQMEVMARMPMPKEEQNERTDD